MKEKQQNHNKRFIEERKMALTKQDREKQKLKITHDKQLEMLAHDIQKKIDLYKYEEMEYEMRSEKEFFF